MKKIIRLTESDLTNIVKKVIEEQQTAAYVAGQQVGKQVQQGVKKAGQAVKNVAVKTGQAIKDAVVSVVSMAGKVLKFYVMGAFCVVYIGVQAFKLSVDLGKKVLSFLGSLAKQVGGIVVGGAKAAANFTADMAKKAGNNIAGFFTSLFNIIKGLGAKAWAGALQLASKIGDIWQYIKNWATDALKSAWSSVKAGASKAYNTVKKGVSNAWNAAGKAVDDTWNAASGFVSGVFSESVIRAMLEDYHYYNQLPLKSMINEIRIDTRQVIF